MLRFAFLFTIVSCFAWAQESKTALSKFLDRDLPLNADPQSELWRDAPSVIAANDIRGNPVPGHRTEIRSRWTATHLYFLFICPYQQLYLKPEWSAERETNKLWEWDVAEIFIGADHDQIWRYREYQVSPRAEWVDLDIDRKTPLPEGGWLWNSGFTVAASLDESKKVWIGAMKIPIASITSKPVDAGFEFRANYYRLQGPPPKRTGVAWLPTMNNSHHTPEAFGIVKLVK